jgi:hypothetical protein
VISQGKKLIGLFFLVSAGKLLFSIINRTTNYYIMREQQLEKAVNALRNSKYTIAFTGAGISVESGIPPFRGENGIWEKYDPQALGDFL